MRGHVEERLAVDEAEIDPPRAALRDDAGGRVEVRRDAERAGEIVGGAHRQDAERQAALDHPERRRVDGAVAAADRDAVDVAPMLDDERRQLLAAAALPVDGLDPVRFERSDRPSRSCAAPLRLLALTMRRARRRGIEGTWGRRAIFERVASAA